MCQTIPAADLQLRKHTGPFIDLICESIRFQHNGAVGLPNIHLRCFLIQFCYPSIRSLIPVIRILQPDLIKAQNLPRLHQWNPLL